MILKIFLLFFGTFALKREDQVSKSDLGSFVEEMYKNASFAKPKFNEDCDENSLEAARECEVEFENLTDTGEDSKRVHRRIWSKVCRAPPR